VRYRRQFPSRRPCPALGQITNLPSDPIKLMSFKEECEFPSLADRKIMDAFRAIKEFLRRWDRCGLVDKHGAEYGSVRNLCGSRTIFVIQAVGGIVMCGFTGNWPHWIFTLGCRVNCFARTLGTIRVACSSQNVGAERGRVCWTRVGDIFELGRRNA
jgi:hypothetical protein